LGSFREFLCKIKKRTYFQAGSFKKLRGTSKDNGVRKVKVLIANKVTVKNTIFPYRNICKYTWSPSDGKTHCLITF